MCIRIKDALLNGWFHTVAAVVLTVESACF